MNELALRAGIIATAVQMNERRINSGKSGNVSARTETGFLMLAALSGRRACLLANHGMIAVDTSLDAALALAIEVEVLAEQYWRALQVGTPNLLSDAEMSIVLEKFKSYSQLAG